MVPHPAVRQRGAIGLMAALTLGLALLFMLLTVDSGRLYLEQRKLQRIADMAALEAAEHGGVCSGAGVQASVLARTAATRNGHSVNNPLIANCGYLRTGTDNLRVFTADNSRPEAIKVEVRNAVTTSAAGGLFSLIDGNFSRTATLHASAVAAKAAPPQAMLRIRSTLATLDSRHSTLLNALLTSLGGNAQLNLAGWQGIADTQINLLKYVEQLAVDLNIKAGDYDKLLNTDATLTQLLNAAVHVLQQSSSTLGVATNLGNVAVGTPSGKLHLGDILDIQNGTAQAGLDSSIQLLQLVQGVIQLAVSKNAANVDLPISVLGLVNGRVQMKVIQPEQVSAVGNPATDVIEVHTAQVQALVSLDLPLLDGVLGLVNAVTSLAAPLTSVLNDLLHLNLVGVVQSLTCALGLSQCKYVEVKVVPDKASLHIGIEVAKAESRVSDYRCLPDKRLTATTRSAAAVVTIGKYKDANTFFLNGSSALTPLPLVDIGIKTCGPLGAACTRAAFAGGGLGLKANAPILQATVTPLLFEGASAPPDINQLPAYLRMNNQDVVGSLTTTFAGVQIEAYKPDVNNVFGDLMNLVAGTLTTVKSILEPLIKNLLSPLIDPLLNVLLKTLGIDLANAQVGANLSCSSGHAQLLL
ncbi:pilus assembly protein TadG-related protein [Pseudomonas sichuanensis]|uniref:pilus assembly protein TadG-related protein n=1 Tax=Pseudomonas sichuanensis TaxID=2213015 RepID=UPI00244C75D2|nr:pilus assembly protein TadG-related protein [Pseudomonas sichuanensis]MDH0731351.1 pilus assembly protein TadG-related protein [Pseudomonas sichuanensis]MDH1585130.1 pilus assembly protein TadG-related protein [Pseudomonas sichuanensis]MDH1592193.1 pilus assembly protein TadG-related protein [Pseudomonas sichuanensis]MDH1598365.1 pilus assembly protein TadG-related protein [Pseudomonas sichuanensis]